MSIQKGPPISYSLAYISSQHNTKKRKRKGKECLMCVHGGDENSCTSTYTWKWKGCFWDSYFFTCFASSPLHYHSLDTWRKDKESERSTKYIHLCILIIKWKGCSDQKFMTSFSRVVVTLICFVVFSRSPTCACVSLSHSLIPSPPSSNIFSSFIIIIEQKKNVDNTEVYISPNMFSFRTSSELSTAQTRKLNEGSICIEEWNFCLSVFSLKASNTEGRKLNS